MKYFLHFFFHKFQPNLNKKWLLNAYDSNSLTIILNLVTYLTTRLHYVSDIVDHLFDYMVYGDNGNILNTFYWNNTIIHHIRTAHFCWFVTKI